jgi:hypothetical protein
MPVGGLDLLLPKFACQIGRPAERSIGAVQPRVGGSWDKHTIALLKEPGCT